MTATHTMRRVALLFLLILRLCSFAKGDEEVLATGDWSKPVSYSGCSLRGRLLLCKSPKNQAVAVYVELQECSESWGGNTAVFCDLTAATSQHPKPAVVWEMKDEAGKPVPASTSTFSGGAPGASWISLPADSTVRLRASVIVGPWPEDGNLSIFFLSSHWLIPKVSSKDYWLGCTLTAEPSADIAAPAGDRVWKGTLVMPKMKMPVQRP